MKKIPTVFVRDPDDRSRLTDKCHSDCLWVFKGEGIPTYKLDGACCIVENGKLWKRREIKRGHRKPEGFTTVHDDAETGKTVGWVPVGDGPEDQWFREGLANRDGPTKDGTYELMGPKVQGNPQGLPEHVLLKHGSPITQWPVPLHLEGLERFLVDVLPTEWEGIVWHHPDGRMAKIKRRDFKRP